MRLFLAAATAVASIWMLSGPAVAATPATVTRTYQASTATIANPGRGFFTFTETHLADGTDYAPLDAAELIRARTTQARTLVYRIFYLDRYPSVDTLSAGDLALVRADFTTARTAGVKLVVRFAYSSDSDLDAPVDRVVGHVAQLAPVLKGNADVIAAVQAGLVGRWGEWYYTQSFADDPDWTARQRVVDALLAATSPGTPVQVRTPAIKRRLAATVARVGVHNDCFLAGTDDYGTFRDGDREYLATLSRTALVGGETCDVSERSGWANASAEMAAYHWTYLNPSFNADVLDSWGESGLATTSRRLGYRLRLVRATLPAGARPGAAVTATVTLTNDGWAAPVQQRPVRFVITVGSVTRTVTVTGDLRTVQPGRSVILTAKTTMPAGTGTARMYLALPDPAASLASNPAYAIQLANTGVWIASRGWNRLI